MIKIIDRIAGLYVLAFFAYIAGNFRMEPLSFGFFAVAYFAALIAILWLAISVLFEKARS